MPLFSNFSAFLIKNFLGSNDPTPPAIIIFGVIKVFSLFVTTFQTSFSLEISWTLSFKWKFALNGFNCSIKFFVKLSPVHSGIAGIS